MEIILKSVQMVSKIENNFEILEFYRFQDSLESSQNISFFEGFKSMSLDIHTQVERNLER